MPGSFKLPPIYTQVNNTIKSTLVYQKVKNCMKVRMELVKKREEVGSEESMADDYDKSHYIHVYKYHDETCYCK